MSPSVPPRPRDEGEVSFIRAADFDARWVPCRRPFVVTGGELTLEMLDLRYDATGHFYEAPLHVKALGGCFIIDDFGRQLVSPRNLLNRWIVPLENRVDYLNLHTGKSFVIPFEELVIFSTNLEPEDLMDPAFLRRLPYKIEIGAPTLEIYKTIFQKECAKQGIELPTNSSTSSCHKVRIDKRARAGRFSAQVHRRPGGGHLPLHGPAPHFETQIHRIRAQQPQGPSHLAGGANCCHHRTVTGAVPKTLSGDSKLTGPLQGVFERISCRSAQRWPAVQRERNFRSQDRERRPRAGCQSRRPVHRLEPR